MNADKSHKPDEDTATPSLKKPVIVSLAIHVLVLLFLIIGMPHINTRDFDAPPPVMIELAPIGDTAMTDKPPVKAPKKEEPKEELPPPKEEPVKQPPKSEPKKEEPKPEPKPVKEPEPVQEPEPKEELPKPEPEPKREEKPKEEPKKEEPKKEEPAPKKEEDTSEAMDSLLKNLAETEADVEVDETAETDKDALPQPTPDAPLGDRVTMTELDALRYQLMQCWNIPAGAQGAEDLQIEVRIKVNSDRTVQSVEIVDQGRYARDSFFRAAADSARRAVMNPSCSPLKLPPEKYDQWKTTIIVFDPRDMF